MGSGFTPFSSSSLTASLHSPTPPPPQLLLCTIRLLSSLNVTIHCGLCRVSHFISPSLSEEIVS